MVLHVGQEINSFENDQPQSLQWMVVTLNTVQVFSMTTPYCSNQGWSFPELCDSPIYAMHAYSTFMQWRNIWQHSMQRCRLKRCSNKPLFRTDGTAADEVHELLSTDSGCWEDDDKDGCLQTLPSTAGITSATELTLTVDARSTVDHPRCLSAGVRVSPSTFADELCSNTSADCSNASVDRLALSLVFRR